MFKFFNKKKNPGPNDPFKFQDLEIRQGNSSALVDVMGIKKTEDGAVAYAGYILMTQNDKETIYSEIHYDNEELLLIEKSLGYYNIQSWDGFNGPCPPNVLDGYNFTFEAHDENGKYMFATGVNNYPYNYQNIYQYLYNISHNYMVKDTNFTTKYCNFKVPQNWVNEVKVKVSEEYLTFTLETTEKDINLFRFSYSQSELLKQDDVTKIGRIRVDEYNEPSLYILNLRPNTTGVSDKQLEIINNLDEAINTLINSIELHENYTYIE